MAEMEEIEGYARLALTEARMDGDDRPSPRLLCKRLGITIVTAPRGTLVGRNFAQTGTLNGQPLVRVRRGLPPWLEAFHLLHEATHILLKRWRVEREDEEEIANGVAGAIAVPRDPLRRVWRRGEDLRDVIEAWPDVGPTCCALRVGEARLADSIVTIGSRVIYARSERPADARLLEVAAEAARGVAIIRNGLGAYPLADGKRRAAVLCELAA
jgi:hypothetical protein